jgi:virginiamycin B lyase
MLLLPRDMNGRESMRIALRFAAPLVALLAISLLPAPASARIRRFAMPGTLGGEITTGTDGALWFTERNFLSSDSKIGRITTSGKVSQLFSTSDGIGSITAGPDGALWFVDRKRVGGSDLGRITASGNVTTFSPGTGGVAAITVGPDRAIWFSTDYLTRPATAIARLTSEGAVQEFPVPTGFVGIGHLTTGPDKALWFSYGSGADSSGYAVIGIGRLTASGDVKRYAAGKLAGFVGDITVGPDKALWFTETLERESGCYSNRIGRVTTTGTLKEFRLPFDSCPSSIVAGPDGALWFTEGTGGRTHGLGRITTSGRISNFPIPDMSSANSLVVGPDHALWLFPILEIVRFAIPPKYLPCSLLNGQARSRCRASRRRARAKCQRIRNKSRRAACVRRLS